MSLLDSSVFVFGKNMKNTGFILT